MDAGAALGPVRRTDLGRHPVLDARGGRVLATWLFRKARILAIFDDLDTVLLMIPLR